MSLSDATRGFARRLFSLKGERLFRRELALAPRDRPDDASDAEERLRLAQEAARLKAHVVRHRGVGWFPGDGL